MEIRLDRLADEPHEWQETLALTSDDLDREEILELGDVGCRGTIRRSNSGFLLRISLAYQQILACTRCLQPVTDKPSSEVDLLVIMRDPEAAAEDVAEENELAEDDLGALVLEEPMLDTTPIVIEQMQLMIPMKALCREDCAGLCAACGADLNGGPCDCRPAMDPRWSRLAQLADATRKDRDAP